MTVCAIMQPTFLPWAGYFDMIDQADVFVFLDTVEFSARSWQQRNRIKTAKGLDWITLPVASSRAERTAIRDARVAEGAAMGKAARTIAHAYARAGAVKTEHPPIAAFLEAIAPGQSLADVNLAFIAHAMSRLGIETPCVRAGALAADGPRTERLVALAKAVGAKRYLAAPGSAAYLREERAAFDDAGVDIVFHAYAHPVWPQPHGAFASHASVVDLLLNVGEDAAAILRSGRRAPTPAEAVFAQASPALSAIA